MTQTDDFGGDGGRVGGIEHDNPPLKFFKDFIYREKKIERPSVLGESSLPLATPAVQMSTTLGP